MGARLEAETTSSNAGTYFTLETHAKCSSAGTYSAPERQRSSTLSTLPGRMPWKKSPTSGEDHEVHQRTERRRAHALEFERVR